MYEIFSPHVDELIVTNVSDSRGQKSDALDALRLAEQLRIGAIKCSVFKAPGLFSRLRELARGWALQTPSPLRAILPRLLP